MEKQNFEIIVDSHYTQMQPIFKENLLCKSILSKIL